VDGVVDEVSGWTACHCLLPFAGCVLFHLSSVPWKMAIFHMHAYSLYLQFFLWLCEHYRGSEWSILCATDCNKKSPSFAQSSH